MFHSMVATSEGETGNRKTRQQFRNTEITEEYLDVDIQNINRTGNVHKPLH